MTALRSTWFCRAFGHTYISRATRRHSDVWLRPVTVPVAVFCARCGDVPPAPTVDAA